MPGAPQRADRRVHREAARAPRILRRPVDLLALRSSAVRYAARAENEPLCDSGCAVNAIPQSYGTLSHLCASVAHESARSTPSTRWRSESGRAAQSPNAPSTCTHAFGAASRASAIAWKGSNAPVLTSPACAQTIVGSSPSCELRRRAAALLVGRDDVRGRARDRACAASGRSSRGASRRRRRGCAARRPARRARRPSPPWRARRAAPPRAR